MIQRYKTHHAKGKQQHDSGQQSQDTNNNLYVEETDDN